MRIKLLLTFILLVAGCGGNEDNKTAEHGHSDEEIFGGRFKEGKGVELSEVTRKSLGLETTEVTDGKNGSLVPDTSILETADGKFVYVENGVHFIRTPIKTGNSSNGSVEVVDGLYAGDVVVSRPVDFLWYIELQAIRGGVACADGH